MIIVIADITIIIIQSLFHRKWLEIEKYFIKMKYLNLNQFNLIFKKKRSLKKKSIKIKLNEEL